MAEINEAVLALRGGLNGLDAYHQTRRESYDQKQAAELEREEARAEAADIKVDALRKLERKAPYAGVSLANNANPKRPFVFLHDPEGLLAGVDVAAAMRASEDFLEELGNGSFGFVYRTKARGDQPSTVKKVFKPMYRHASAHEFAHLSKFRYFDYFVSTTGRTLSTLMIGNVRCEFIEMSDNPELKSLDVRRKAIEGTTAFCDPECTVFYTVALADIAIALQFMHAAGIIHGNLQVCVCLNVTLYLVIWSTQFTMHLIL